MNPSLLLIPDRYKASKLYSQIPADGAADLDFTRALDTATRVNSAGLIEAVGIDIPRIDYTGGGCGKLLLEPQRTNLFNFSEQFDNAYWDKFSATITANTAISPDGNLNADTINGAGRVQKDIAATGAMTFSVFAKAGTGSVIRLNVFDNVTDRGSSFNLSTGVAFDTYGSPAVSVVNYGNGWYRLIMTTTNAGTSNCQIHMDTATTAFIWGAQLEAGSYVSSYIPTLGASVTRSADAASKTGISSLIGQTQGTLFCDVQLDVRSGNPYFVIAPDLALTANYIGIGFLLTTIVFEVVIGASLAMGITLNNSVPGRFKIAAAYKQNDFAMYVNGVQVGTSTSGNVVACSQFGIFNYTALNSMNYNTAALYPVRLSNSELASLTSL